MVSFLYHTEPADWNEHLGSGSTNDRKFNRNFLTQHSNYQKQLKINFSVKVTILLSCNKRIILNYLYIRSLINKKSINNEKVKHSINPPRSRHKNLFISDVTLYACHHWNKEYYKIVGSIFEVLWNQQLAKVKYKSHALWNEDNCMCDSIIRSIMRFQFETILTLKITYKILSAGKYYIFISDCINKQFMLNLFKFWI